MTRDSLSRRFCDHYLGGAKRLFERGAPTVPSSLGWITSLEALGRHLHRSTRYPWMVNVQTAPPHCEGPDAALKYLAQYASGAAIQDVRIVSATSSHVTIQYKDYRHERRVKHQTMTGIEFVERFSWHILPKRIFHGSNK